MFNNYLKEAITTFKKARIPSHSLDAEILLSHALQKPKEFLYAHPEYELTKKELKRYKEYVARRLQREPVAYIVNKKEFYGYEFYVDRRVLIPRPETEKVIEKTLQCIHSKFQIPRPPCSPQASGQANSKFLIVDVGTGSGCIIISIIKELLRKNLCNTRGVKYQCIGTDVSKPALEVAKINAKKHKIENLITFAHGNLLSPVLKKNIIKKSSHIIITANLPYLAQSVYDALEPEITLYEPEIALLTPHTTKTCYYYTALNQQISLLKKKTSALLSTFFEMPTY